jgi:putative tricarboxylic transport membrane protein
VAPRGVPDAAIAAQNAALATAFDDPQVQERFAQFATMAPAPAERTPDHLAALIAREGQRWGELLRAAGVQKEG